MITEIEMKVIVNRKEDDTLIVSTFTNLSRNDRNLLSASSSRTIPHEMYNGEKQLNILSMILDDSKFFQSLACDLVRGAFTEEENQ